MMEPRPLILAIESGIAGGSVALLSGADVVATAVGDGLVSRAEELLPAIERLLGEAQTPISSITSIAVSRGPGSFTGIRIGMSTSIGLARSLDVPCIGVSIFDAIKHSFAEPDIFIAVPISRSDIAIGRTSSADSSVSAEIADLARLTAIINEKAETRVIVHGSIFDSLAAADRTPRVVSIGYDLASFLGRYALASPGSSLSPIYLQHPAKRGSLF